MFTNIFSIGDVCLASVNEEKSVVSLYTFSEIVAHNIKLLSSQEY